MEFGPNGQPPHPCSEFLEAKLRREMPPHIARITEALAFLADYLLGGLVPARLGLGLHTPSDRLVVRQEVVAAVSAVVLYAALAQGHAKSRVQQPHINVPVLRFQQFPCIQALCALGFDYLFERPAGINEIMKRPHLAVGEYEGKDLTAHRPGQPFDDFHGCPEP